MFGVQELVFDVDSTPLHQLRLTDCFLCIHWLVISKVAKSDNYLETNCFELS